MLKWDSIFILKDENIVMKNEIKRLAAVTISALGVLAFSSETFCQCSSTKSFGPAHGGFKEGKSVTESDKLLFRESYIAYPGEKDPVNELYGNINRLIYPIGTFDVKRFYKVIELNKINS